MEARLREEKERERERVREVERQREMREIQIAAQRERERAERERERSERDRESHGNGNGKRILGSGFFQGLGMGSSSSSSAAVAATQVAPRQVSPVGTGVSQDMPVGERRKVGRPAAKSVSFAQGSAFNPANLAASASAASNLGTISDSSSTPSVVGSSSGHKEETSKLGPLPSINSTLGGTTTQGLKLAPVTTTRLQHSATISGGRGVGGSGTVGRPRANTSPWLPSHIGGDHQSWFNDPRFDASFPSRVLPFLYLGNL